jgi:hypothetical protein
LWTGTGSSYLLLDGNRTNETYFDLHQIIHHCGNDGNGTHWIPVDNSLGITAGGDKVGDIFYLWVRPIATLGILSQPSTASQNICSGSSPTALSVTASGASTYQWYSNASPSNSGGTPISGATTSLLLEQHIITFISPDLVQTSQVMFRVQLL